LNLFCLFIAIDVPCDAIPDDRSMASNDWHMAYLMTAAWRPNDRRMTYLMIAAWRPNDWRMAYLMTGAWRT
jgi:hypothetical protein